VKKFSKLVRHSQPEFVFDHSNPPRQCIGSRATKKDPDMMSHDEFVLGYENGSLGCSVSVLLALRLFFFRRIREKKISKNLLFWSLGFLLLIASSVLAFLKLPLIWAILCTAITLAFYASAFFYSFGALVLSAALANEDFYKVAIWERALWIYSDDEKNLPKLQNDQN
jgi:hypothetical protein